MNPEPETIDFDSLRPEDFDGHSKFSNLTISQRLAWLSGAIRFVHQIRERRPKTEPAAGGEASSEVRPPG